MATPVLIPIAEYLNSTYRPDCDYVDGELRERNVGERPHGLLQNMLSSLFLVNRRAWGLVPITEQRVQTGETNFRIPDVCVIRPVPGQEVVTIPPVVCIEVLSKGDSLHSIRDRIDDYLKMGVENVWVFDPVRHRVYSASKSGYQPLVDVLTIDGTPVRIALAELFQELDDLLAGRL